MIKFWKTQKTTSKMLVVFLHFVVFAAKSQYNLVPNPSFEIYTVCPSLMYKTPPTFWLMSTNPYYSYSNSCANLCIFGVPRNNFGGHNYQYPKTGNGYLALALYYYDTKPNKRSYIAVKLTDSLILGKRYYVGYHISLTNEARIATNNAGLLFTNNVVYVDTITTPYGVLNANPQITNYANPIIRDTQNWVKVSGFIKHKVESNI